jgi:hypothetical protein
MEALYLPDPISQLLIHATWLCVPVSLGLGKPPSPVQELSSRTAWGYCWRFYFPAVNIIPSSFLPRNLISSGNNFYFIILDFFFCHFKVIFGKDFELSLLYWSRSLNLIFYINSFQLALPLFLILSYFQDKFHPKSIPCVTITPAVKWTRG